MMCDESFENILNQEIDVFEYTYQQSHILCRYLPQTEVLDSLLNFNVSTAVISRNLTEQELAHLKAKKPLTRISPIAVDAVALIVNPANEINTLSTDEVADILSGRDSLWTQLWPDDKLGKINIYFDNGGSSMVQFMRQQVLDGAPFGGSVYGQGSVPAVFEAVKNDKNALGIVGVSWLTTDMASLDLPADQRRELTAEMAEKSAADGSIEAPSFNTSAKVLNIRRSATNGTLDPKQFDAVKPYQQYIYDGTYPYTREIFMITTSPSGSIGGGFYSFVTGIQGQKIITLTGIMPKRVPSRVVELQ